MTDSCSLELLESALAGNLPRDREECLHRHLEECPACTSTLERIAGGAELWKEAATMFAADESDLGLPAQEDWSDVDFTVEHLEPSDNPDALGRLGGYDVLEIIGRGGMGVVLKGFDRELNRYIAIKVLAPHLAVSSLAKKRFAREAQAAAAVVHPHVMAIHQVQQNGRLPFLVMPLVTGESLAQRLAEQGRLELKETLRIGMQAAAALAAAHEQGLVHRDVKPANILLEKGIERAVLTDFGLARAADDDALTRRGLIAGTPQYMSPEQAQGEFVDSRSDLFSLGCVLYEMASGVSPFRADSTLATLRRLVDHPPPSLATLNPELPPWFVAIVERLLEKDPTDRYSSAKEVSELLEHCLAHVQQPTAVPLPACVAGIVPMPSARSRNREGSFLWECVKSLAFGGRHGDRACYNRITRSVINTKKGTLIVLSLISISLFAAAIVSTNPPDIAGQWQGEGWGQVTLKQTAPGDYTGTYTETVAKEKQPGKIELKWSRIECRYNGTWREGDDDRFGDLSIHLVEKEIRGALTTDAKSKINPATPRLAEVTWIKSPADSSASSGSGKPEEIAQAGWQLWQRGKLAEAEAKFKLSAELDPRNANAWNGLGWAQFNAGKGDEAIHAFDKAVKLEPDHPGALNGLGQIYLSQGKYSTAEWFLLLASPKASAAWFGLARLYLLQGKFDQAEKWAKKVVDSGGDDGTAKAMLEAAKTKHLSDELRAKLEPSQTAEPQKESEATKPEQAMQAGWQLWRKGKLAEAKAKFKQAVELDPKDANAWNGLGWSLFNAGKGDEAIHAFEEAVKIAPDHPAALNGLGQIYLSQGKYAEAEKYLLKAAPQASAAWYGLARLYLLQGKFEQAEPWAKKVVELPAGDDVDKPMLKAMYEAAKAKHLSDELRAKLEPTRPAEPQKESSQSVEPVSVTDPSIEDATKIALQHALTRIIGSMPGIKGATVRLDVVQESSASGKPGHKTASVVVQTQGSMRIDREQANKLRNLIAGAWVGLKAENVTVADQNGIVTVDNDQPKRLRRFDPGIDVGTIACSADGKLIAVGIASPPISIGVGHGPRVPDNWQPTVKILGAETGKPITTLKVIAKEEQSLLEATGRVPIFDVASLAFSPDSKLVAVGTSIGLVKLFDARSGDLVRSLDDMQGKIADSHITEEIARLARAMGSADKLAFSPDGSLLAVGGNSFIDRPLNWAQDQERAKKVHMRFIKPGRLKLWDVKTGALRHDLAGYSNVDAVSFSPDGKRLAGAGNWGDNSGSFNGVKVWNPVSGEMITTILAHDHGGSLTAAFSPDGSLLAIGDERYDLEMGNMDQSSGEVNIMHAASGARKWCQRVPAFPKLAGFLPDGKNIVVFGAWSGRAVQFLDTETGKLKNEIGPEESTGRERWSVISLSPQAHLLAIGGVDEDQHGKDQHDFVEVWGIDADSEKLSAAASISESSPQISVSKKVPATAPPIAKPNDATLPLQKSQASLPPYRIESPDLLQIELLNPTSGTNLITGQYLVGVDRIVKLGNYGSVFMAGKTVTEGRATLEKQLAKYFKSPTVSLDVVAYYSKVYYVVTHGPTLGDTVRQFQVTGNETALDAITQVNGLSLIPRKEIWISRLDANEPTKWKHLPIDWDAISQGAQTATNYQVLPFDVVFVEDQSNESTRRETPAMPPTSSGTSTRQELAKAGWQLWQAGKIAEAEAKFKLVVQSDPHNADAWSSLGWSLSYAGKGDIAILAFREALKIVPDHPATLAGLGQALLSKGDYDEAENYLLRAAPHSPVAGIGLAQLYLLQGKFEQAEKWAKTVVDSGPCDETVKAMYEAAKAKHLSNELRAKLRPKQPAKKD